MNSITSSGGYSVTKLVELLAHKWQPSTVSEWV